MKNILIINGHPDKESYCSHLALAYKKRAESAGAQVNLIKIKPVEITSFSLMKTSDEAKRKKWIEKVEVLGRELN